MRVMIGDEYAEAARILAKLEPGFLPFDIFQQVARLVTLPIVEIVPLRTNADGDIEVLLLKREATDPIFAGQLHTPGCVVRPTDKPESFDTAFQRLLVEEMGGVMATEPVYVTQMLHHSGRGLESSHIYWVEVLGEPTVGAFYPVANLPDNFMSSQLDFLPKAVMHYQEAMSRPGTGLANVKQLA